MNLRCCVGWVAVVSCLLAVTVRGAEPMQVGFLWHMHQPIYYPGETVTQTQAAGHFSYSVTDIFNQRFGPYTTWPKDAIDAGQSLAHLGAQVSFSGSLIENLNNLEAAGVNGGMWNNWDSSYNQAQGLSTSLGNPRLDLVAFGYYHPLMPLLDERDMRMQIKLHKQAYQQTWGNTPAYSKGMFPAETAFSERMIPALVAEGMDWVMVDNLHFDRATQNYPYTPSSNLMPPNKADQINPDPAASGGAWVQLNNLWAPSKVSAPFSYQPHNVQYVNPNTGSATKIVAVPAARYEGNEDGRGGYGALQYESVMEQYRQYNTDPAHPLFVLLHHDGDNYGGGSEGYYHSNFQNMVSWAAANPNYDVTTVQDYLQRYPVAANDIIHVENGSWAGADNGDPEFKKWLGDPNGSGWSPDRNSWAVLTAAKNRVFTADDIAPYSSVQNIMTNTGSATEKAWHYLAEAEASDYWYWDGTEVWDSNVTRGSNLAVALANQVLTPAAIANETTPPSVFVPQREAYNPGGIEWGTTPQSKDFEVWTYAYDVSGLSSVTLKYRLDADGTNPLASTQNETYAGGAEVGPWTSVSMASSDVAPPANILTPTYRALRYGGMIAGLSNQLVDYYVEAVDNRGNITRSDIQHVWVGDGSGGSTGGSSVVTVDPTPVVAGMPLTVTYDPANGPLAGASQIYMHYGFNNWQSIAQDLLMTWNAATSTWGASVPIGLTTSQFDVVFNNGSGIWDNNSGQDWHFSVRGTQAPSFVMDGVKDAAAQQVAVNGSRHLYAALSGTSLYVATDDAGEGNDVFIYMARTPGALTTANWAKAGQIAQWDAYLADENDNDYESWFDASGATQAGTGANGGVLEGVIDLAGEFGSMPTQVYLAVGAFATANGGALVPSQQVPASVNANGTLDASEYMLFKIVAGAGDYNRDGHVDNADYLVFRSSFGSQSDVRADGNGNGVVDVADYTIWRKFSGTAAGFTLVPMGLAGAAAVPEPAMPMPLFFGAVLVTTAARKRI